MSTIGTTLFSKIEINGQEVDIATLDANDGIYALPAGQTTANVKFTMIDNTSIPRGVFEENSYITAMTLPDAMTYIASYSFHGVNNINISDKNAILAINPYAFNAEPGPTPPTPDPDFHFNNSNYEITSGSRVSMKYKLTNNTQIDTDQYPIQWSSSSADIEITSQRSGEIRSNVVGATGTITATLSDGTNTHTATCTVNVVAPKQNPTGQWYNDGNPVGYIDVVQGGLTTYTLTFSGTPSDSWTFQDPMVTGISVDQVTGTITITESNLNTTGSVTINASRSEDTSYYEGLAQFYITVQSSTTPVDPDIYFMSPTLTVDYQMEPNKLNGNEITQALSGNDASQSAWIVWSTDNSSIATVNNGGYVVAHGNGTTNISAEYTAHDTYNYKKVEYSLTITNYNSSIEPVDNSFYFMDSNRTLYNSGADMLQINNNTGIDTVNYPIQWSSSNANITVDQNGVVSWTMTGETATITATLSDGTNTHTATCTVTTAVNKTSPYGNWYEDGNMITQLTLVEGAIDAHDLTFNGTPSDSWTFSGTLPSGISVDSSTGEIIVSALSSAAAGDYYITGNRMEDSTYWSGMTSFTIKVLPSGTNPQFYYEQQSVNLDNSAMQTQSPMLHNEYAGMGYDVTYSSADTSVATVDAYGMISFAGAGNTTVTATLSNSGNTIATATISVYCTSSTKTVSVISNEFVNGSEGLATSEKFKIGYFDYGDTIGAADLSITYTTNSSASISISNVKLKLRSGSKIYASITFDLTVGQGVAANDTVSIYAELTDNGSGCSMANTLVGNIVLVPTA